MLRSVLRRGVLSFSKGVMIDTTSNAITFNMKSCINCQACVRACKSVAGQSILKPGVVDGKNVIVTASGDLLKDTLCISCGQCSLVCSTKAIKEVDAIEPLRQLLANKNGKVVVAQFAPAVRISTAESLGYPAGSIVTGKIVTALKKLGFDYVFDTNFGADLTIVEEATELLHRLKDPKATLPMFTSCCPAWVNYVELSDPSMIPHLSTARSPVAMLSSIIKSDFAKLKNIDPKNIVNVIFVPCTAKKDESLRPQLTVNGDRSADITVTSRELAQMIKDAKMDFKKLPESECDDPYRQAAGGGAIFCATGGVMEAAVRMAFNVTTGKDMPDFEPVRGLDGVKFGKFSLNGKEINVAVAQGIKNAMTLISRIKKGDPQCKDLHFCEVMACPGGCVVGGGAPRANKKAVQKRLEATYKVGNSMKYRASNENPQIIELYERSLEGKFGSHSAHELLHTHFTPRPVKSK